MGALGASGRQFESGYPDYMVKIAQLVRVPDCGSGGYGFDARSSP